MTPTKVPPNKVRGTNGHHNGSGHSSEPSRPVGPPPGWPKRRTSVWPLLLDLGLVLAGFGLIILRPLAGELYGNIAIAVGVVLFGIALFNWIKEARQEYKQLKD